MASSPLIDVRNVTYSPNGTPVLQDITTAFHPNTTTTIIGPNGAGKSSLLKLILGLAAPSQGTITYRPKIRLGYMPQKLHLDPRFPVTVTTFLSLWQTGSRELYDDLVKRLKITPLLHTSMHHLSGGEMQRVLLMRACMSKPDVLVLDEPIQGVDIAGQEEFYTVIEDYQKRLGVCLIMVSHDLHRVMASSQNVICLNTHICCSGSPSHIQQDPQYHHLFGTHHLAPYLHHHDHCHTPVCTHDHSPS